MLLSKCSPRDIFAAFLRLSPDILIDHHPTTVQVVSVTLTTATTSPVSTEAPAAPLLDTSAALGAIG